MTGPPAPPPEDISRYRFAGALMVVFGGVATMAGRILIDAEIRPVLVVGAIALGFLGLVFLGTAEELASAATDGERTSPGTRGAATGTRTGPHEVDRDEALLIPVPPWMAAAARRVATPVPDGAPRRFRVAGYDTDPAPEEFHAAIRAFLALDGPQTVLDQIRPGTEAVVARDTDGDRHVYVLAECECDREPEHGMHIVFRDGVVSHSPP